MGYVEKLKAALAPLGVYKLEEGAGAAELFAVGTALDGVVSDADETRRECVLQNAEEWGLRLYEELFPLKPAYLDTASRRGALMALLQVNGASFTPERINATLAGCGIRAVATETEKAQTVSVSFPDVRGVPDGIEEMKFIIESILPCHLNVKYKFIFITWAELEGFAVKWSALETVTWEKFEKLQ